MFVIYCKRRPRCRWDNYGSRDTRGDALMVAQKNLADVRSHGAPDAQIIVREYDGSFGEAPEHLSGSYRPDASETVA